MFTAKHFNKLAQLLRALDLPIEDRDAIAKLFEAFFVEESPRFKSDVWWREIRRED